MHPLYERANALTKEVIGAAIEVHRELGPGLIESIYERCLIHELQLRGIAVEKQRVVRVRFKDLIFEEELRYDVLVEQCLLLELKAVETVAPIHQAKLLSYMKLLDIPIGLVINFHELKLVDGIRRMVLRGADDTH
jgi:GxxExxY protein